MPTISRTGINAARRPAGFTLVELTIVIFIMAVVMALAVPSFVRHYNASLVFSATRSFATFCQLARIQAVMRQQPAVLHIDVPGQRIWLTQAAGSNDADAVAQPGETSQNLEISPRIALVSAELADPTLAASNDVNSVTVTFYPNGTCDGVTVVFRGANKTDTLGAVLDPITARATPVGVRL